jgi:hypothetical protein
LGREGKFEEGGGTRLIFWHGDAIARVVISINIMASEQFFGTTTHNLHHFGNCAITTTTKRGTESSHLKD